MRVVWYILYSKFFWIHCCSLPTSIGFVKSTHFNRKLFIWKAAYFKCKVEIKRVKHKADTYMEIFCSLFHSAQCSWRTKFFFHSFDFCSLSKLIIYKKTNLLKGFHFSKFFLWFKDATSDIWTHKLPPDLDPFVLCYLMLLLSGS